MQLVFVNNSISILLVGLIDSREVAKANVADHWVESAEEIPLTRQ